MGGRCGFKVVTIAVFLAAAAWLVGFSLTAVAQESTPQPLGRGDWPGGLRYTVQPGDTLLSVSIEMGMDLQDMSCLLTPTFTWDQPLVIGDVLTVPDAPFACHVVQPGETLSSIAARFGVPPERIRGEPWNALGAGEPEPGRNLRIPLEPGPDTASSGMPIMPGWRTSQPAGGTGGRVGPAPVDEFDAPADWPYGSGQFSWPTYGWLSQGFRIGHSAIDIAAPTGTPVFASDRGVVIRAGWSDVGYGNFVVIDHNIDYLTLYAHLSVVAVREGQVVAKGQVIGWVGSTGNSTGPHLHFEIRDFGHRVDPLRLLP